ncbi:DUF4240 domain-containing protein [Gemmiger formicilis]|jgi:hypothetical protein
MTEREHLEKVKQLSTMNELPIHDEAALLEFRLNKSDPLEIEEEYINVYIPVTFDADKAFGLDIGQDTNDDNIDLYAEWRVGEVDSLAMYVTYRNNSTVDGDFYFRVPLNERQQQRIHARLEEQCRAVYGKSIAELYGADIPMTLDEFWAVIDRANAEADTFDSASVRNNLYRQLIKLTPQKMLGFDCIWQEYRSLTKSPVLYGAAAIINGGVSDDRFDYFKNWLILQGHDTYLKAVDDPDTLADIPIPFEDAEWEDCGYVAGHAYDGQQFRTYLETSGAEKELNRKYPDILNRMPNSLDEWVMWTLFLAPSEENKENNFDIYMFSLEMEHYLEVSGLEYSYDKFYQENIPNKCAWARLRGKILAELPRQPQDFAKLDITTSFPKLWQKRQRWEQKIAPPNRYRGEER